VIKWFDRAKGFGYVIAGRQEFFFHAVECRSVPAAGNPVEFDVVTGIKGPRAVNLR